MKIWILIAIMVGPEGDYRGRLPPPNIYETEQACEARMAELDKWVRDQRNGSKLEARCEERER